mmetsp:Transcript_15574/g.42266  ORF Transcript_15574/g.42266 Transcript_15574/m.42266 type:complete len:146 (-) Transcript_15574:359-796(-)
MLTWKWMKGILNFDLRSALNQRSDFGDDEEKERLKVAKLLAFASSAGTVAWNKFSQIWLLSVGLSPTQAGVLKSVGLLAKTGAQPMWAAIADMEIPARFNPNLRTTSMHATAVISIVLSLVLLEALRRYVFDILFISARIGFSST